MNVLDYFTPTGEQFVGLLSLLGVSGIFAVIGGWCGGGPRRFTPADVFVGWGVASGLFILAGVFLWLPFTWIAYLLLAAAAIGVLPLWRRDRRKGIHPAAIGRLWRIVILALPLILLVAAMRASQWDEFTQWLPNSLYLLRHDAFPRSGLPESPVGFAAYPYGLPLVNYLVSRFAGVFVENAGAMFNLLLLLFYAPILIDTIGRGLTAPPAWSRGWGTAALGILGVTVLSTTFVQKLVLTSYADSATSATLAVIGVLAWRLLDILGSAAERPEAVSEARPLAWQFGLVMVIFVYLKQSNLVLAALLLCAMVLVTLRDPRLRLADLLRLAPALLLPGAVAYLTWRYHVAEHLSGREFAFRGLNDWFWADALAVLGRMLSVAASKAVFFVMMAAIAVLAARALWRFKGSFDRLVLLVATVFVGYNLFLWAAYLGAFDLRDALRAGSFWRYNTQLGLLGCTAAAYGLALVWRRYATSFLADRMAVTRLLPVLGVVLVPALSVAFSEKLRFDLRPWKDHIRTVGRELARDLPPGARISVVDPEGNGLAFMMIKYELVVGPGLARDIDLRGKITVYSDTSDEGLRKSLDDPLLTHAWVHKSLANVQMAMGVTLAPRNSHLLRRDGGRWQLEKSWPYDGYDDPYSEPD